MEDVRIAYAWTTTADLSADWATTTVVYGPTDRASNSFTEDVFNDFDITDLYDSNGDDSNCDGCSCSAARSPGDVGAGLLLLLGVWGLVARRRGWF